MDNSKVCKPEFINLNDTVTMYAMEMVIEGAKDKEMSLIDKALKIMETFRDAPIIDIHKDKFEERFGE